MNYITKYQDFNRVFSLKTELRNIVRKNAILALSATKWRPQKNSIYFPYYHHVFDDEKKNFERQLQFFQNQGDFITLDEVVKLFQNKEKISGTYFSITFDDGFKNCLTNACEIMLKYQCKGAFFVLTDFIGLHFESNQKELIQFYHNSTNGNPVEFLTWEDCKEIKNMGMIIGSHTTNHAHLIDQSEETLMHIFSESKKKIEVNLGVPCEHFACTWGIPGKDFIVGRENKLVEEIGYKDFLTTLRGANKAGTDPFFIRRDHVLANWEIFQLRYFFS